MSTIPSRLLLSCHSTTTCFLLGFLNNYITSSRFVNTHGLPGRNIPAELHMENLNHLCKDAVSHLGANKTPKDIIQTGKAVQPMSDVLHHFDNENGIDHGSGAHTQRSESGDLSEIVHEIHKNSCVFTNIPGCKHTSFPSLTCNMFGSI